MILNKTFSVCDKILKENMAEESCKTNEVDRSIHKSQGYCCEGLLTPGKMLAYSKIAFPPKTGQALLPEHVYSRWWTQRPSPISYASPEVTGVYGDVDKYVAESVKEAHKQITLMGLLKPILKNTEEWAMASGMERVVTIDMVHGSDTLKKDLAEDGLAHFRTKVWRQVMHW